MRSATSSSTRGPRCCSSTPRSSRALAGVSAKVRIVLDGSDDAELFAPAPAGARPAPWDGDEDGHVLDQLHVGDDGAARRGCSSPTATAGSTPPCSDGTRR